MPPTSGCATRSSASRPKRRRTKEPRLSSLSFACARGKKIRRPCAVCRARKTAAFAQTARTASARARKSLRAVLRACRDERYKFFDKRPGWKPGAGLGPARSHRRNAQGFSLMNESGPASIRKSPIRSVAMLPPRRVRAFEQQYLELERLFFIELDDAMGGGESGDAAADDDDALHDWVNRGSRMEDQMEIGD